MRHAAVVLLLTALTIAVFWPTLSHEFVIFDDDTYVTDNPRVARGLVRDNLVWAFNTTYFSNWHPITWLSYYADAELFGVDARAFHRTNLILHVLNTLLLYALFGRMTKAWGASAFLAAFFAVHPLHVESVAWISERKDLLSGCFGLLALHAYVSYTRNPRVPMYLVITLAFALGLMAKPMLVTLPFVMLLLDYWPLRRIQSGGRTGRLILEKMPLFVLSAASASIAFYAQASGGAVSSLQALPIWQRIANAFVAYALYLAKTVWPVDLGPYYPLPRDGYAPALIIASVSIVVLVSFVAVASVRSRPHIFTGWFWFVGMLVPVIGVVQISGQALADRYTYLPLIGVFLAVIWQLREFSAPAPTRRVVLTAVGLLLLVAHAAVATIQTTYWRNSETLFRRALAVTENNYLAHTSLAAVMRHQDPTEAERHLQTALDINPDFPYAHLNMGLLRADEDDLESAINHFEQAVALRPSLVPARVNLAVAHLMQGNTDEARVEYQTALEYAPDHTDALLGLAEIDLGQGRLDDARQRFERILELDRENIEAWYGLGRILSREGKFAEAIEHYHEALNLDPNPRPDILTNIGNAYAQSGRLEPALQAYRAALEADPDRPLTHLNMATALLLNGDRAAAVRHAREAVRLDPGFQPAKELLRELEPPNAPADPDQPEQ